MSYVLLKPFLLCSRSNQGNDEKWWVSILIFVGIYIVLMMGG